MNSSYATIKTVMHQLYDGLHEVLMKLLRNAETKEAVLQYLGEVIQKNANRSQLQVSVLFHFMVISHFQWQELDEDLMFGYVVVVVVVGSGKPTCSCKQWNVC